MNTEKLYSTQLVEYLEKQTERCTVELIIKNLDSLSYSNGIDKEELCSNILDMLTDIDPMTIYSWVSYIRKLANESLTHDIYSKDNYKKPCFVELHLELKRKKFTGELHELLLIDEIIEHCLDEFPVKIEEMNELLHMIVDYCEKKNNKTFNYLTECLLVSKIVTHRCKVPLAQLKKRAKQEAEEWDNLLQKCSKYDIYKVYEKEN